MTRLELQKAGRYLSGRSRAREFIDSMGNVTPGSRVVIDLGGIDWITQSFVSELLLSLKSRDIDIADIEVNATDKQELFDRVEKEIDRLKKIWYETLEDRRAM